MEETKIDETKVEETAVPVDEVKPSEEEQAELTECAKEIAAVLEKYNATLRIQNNILVAKK